PAHPELPRPRHWVHLSPVPRARHGTPAPRGRILSAGLTAGFRPCPRGARCMAYQVRWSVRGFAATAVLSALALGAPGLSAPRTSVLPPVPPPPAAPGVYEGISRPSRALDLAFAVRGKVAELLVEPGQKIELGQKLVRLDDAVQQQNVNL